MRSKMLIGAMAAVSMLVIHGAASAGSIVTNGGFESGTSPGGSFLTLDAGSTAIDGWTIGGAGVDYIGGYWAAAEGNRSVDLSAMSAGSVSQDLLTQPGHLYQVTFEMAGNYDGGNFTKEMRVDFGGASEVFSFDQPSNWSHSAMGYVTYSMNMVAHGESSALTFTSLENNPFGPVLDDVSVTSLRETPSAAVPLPASAMGGGVLLGMIALARKRAAAVR